MHDRLAMALQDDLTEKIVATHVKGVLVDISALEMVDSFIGRMLGNIAAMSRELDAETVVASDSRSRTPAAALVVSELATNLAKHANGGELLLRVLPDAEGTGEAGIEVVAIDRGPGMPGVASFRRPFSRVRRA